MRDSHEYINTEKSVEEERLKSMLCQVWVFSTEEEDSTPLSLVPEFLVRMSSTISPRARSKQLVTRLSKFIAATAGVSNIIYSAGHASILGHSFDN